MAKAEPTEKVVIYRYTIEFKPVPKATSMEFVVRSSRTVDAMGYEVDGPWFVFDDTEGTVLTIRQDVVEQIVRVEQVGEQTVDVIA